MNKDMSGVLAAYLVAFELAGDDDAVDAILVDMTDDELHEVIDALAERETAARRSAERCALRLEEVAS